uniref:IS110 family transposase n=1 Tax=Streptococcus pluranimalium TaxID=82348 RepID=UPI003F68D7F1
MEVMIETCCGIDVHQKSIVCCILDGPLDTNKPKKLQKQFGTTTIALQNALTWLEENHVTHVFFESTGQYWLPLFNIFSNSELTLVLANPQNIKNVPARTKTSEKIPFDVSTLRTIEFTTEVDDIEQAKRQLKETIKSIPFSSEDEKRIDENIYNDITTSLFNIHTKLDKIVDNTTTSDFNPFGTNNPMDIIDDDLPF